MTSGDEQLVNSQFPRVHHAALLLKRWLLGTHHGAVRPSYLDYYLDELTFRSNRRASRSRGKLFRCLLEQAVEVGPAELQIVPNSTLRLGRQFPGRSSPRCGAVP